MRGSNGHPGRRLLILTPTTGWGGAEEYMMTVARGARDAAWRVTVTFAADADSSAQRRRRTGTGGVGFVDAPLTTDPSLSGVRRQVLHAARVLARVRPTVAMIVLPWPDMGLGLMLATAVARIPTLVVFQLAPWPLSLPRRAPAYRWSQRHNAQWVAVSGQNRDAIAATFNVATGSIEVIHNGVARREGTDATVTAAARRAVREGLGVPDDAKVVLTVGRLDAQKGYGDLLSIVPSIIERRPDVVFAWAGDGPLRDELQSEIRRNGLDGNVRILGRRSDVPQLLAGSDLFVFPSMFEGHPFALLEAMAACVPVVTSDVGDVPAIVRNRIDALVHPRGDLAELGSSVAWALDHPEAMAEMAVSARSRAGMFSDDEMLRRTLALLDLLSG